MSQQVQHELVHQLQTNVVRRGLVELRSFRARDLDGSVHISLDQLVQLLVLKAASGYHWVIEAAVPTTDRYTSPSNTQYRYATSAFITTINRAI